jgi:hypothetical protein
VVNADGLRDGLGGCSLTRTPSSRPRSSRHSRPSSFRTTSMEPIFSPSSRTVRLKSFKRNRSSFIHVTAEAMHRQRSLKGPWEYNRRSAGGTGNERRRRTVPNRLKISSGPPIKDLRSSIDSMSRVPEELHLPASISEENLKTDSEDVIEVADEVANTNNYCHPTPITRRELCPRDTVI